MRAGRRRGEYANTSIVSQSIVLAQRPPISIPLTSVSPALLDELVADLSSLASAYHKPESTFIGKGRYGADSANKRVTREAALATVVQGQNAENLLDFGDDDEQAAAAPVNSATGGLGALDELVTPSQSSAAPANNSQQLNDLLGLFDAAPPSSGMEAMSAARPQAATTGGGGGDLLDF